MAEAQKKENKQSVAVLDELVTALRGEHQHGVAVRSEPVTIEDPGWWHGCRSRRKGA